MTYLQKYTLVAFLQPVEAGTEFSMDNWPVHMTLADVFAIKLNAKIERRLTDLLAQQSPVSLFVGEDSTLGTTKVALINKNSEPQNLHDKIMDLLALNGAKFNTPEFTRGGFLSHSTIERSGRLYEGSKFKITSVSLVDMFSKGNWRQRKVLSNFNLKQI